MKDFKVGGVVRIIRGDYESKRGVVSSISKSDNGIPIILVSIFFSPFTKVVEFCIDDLEIIGG